MFYAGLYLLVQFPADVFAHEGLDFLFLNVQRKQIVQLGQCGFRGHILAVDGTDVVQRLAGGVLPQCDRTLQTWRADSDDGAGVVCLSMICSR